jgi:hypothetical protein
VYLSTAVCQKASIESSFGLTTKLSLSRALC